LPGGQWDNQGAEKENYDRGCEFPLSFFLLCDTIQAENHRVQRLGLKDDSFVIWSRFMAGKCGILESNRKGGVFYGKSQAIHLCKRKR